MTNLLTSLMQFRLFSHVLRRSEVRRYFAVVLLVLLTGCYHFGAPGSGKFAIDDIHVLNRTKEPTLNRHIVAALREHAGTDPSTAQSGGLVDIEVKLGEIKNYSLARSKVRDRLSIDHDSDAYQTVYHRIEITADVVVTPKGATEPILSKTYIGHGDIPRMHDRELPFQTACRQAANNLAAQVVDDMATLSE